MKSFEILRKAFSQPSKIPHALQIELKTLSAIIRCGLPDAILQFGGGIGDELLLTAVAHELKKRNPGIKIWQVSHSHELLMNNPDYARIFSMDSWFLRYSELLRKFRYRLAYTEELIPKVAEVPPSEHIIKVLCRRAGITGEINVRPYLNLSEDEEKNGRYFNRQIAIQCVGPDSYPTVRKNMLWDIDKFQHVVDGIRNISGSDMGYVQLGSLKDPLLEGVLDMRGKSGLRESASIIRQSECFIGTPGFLMHLARAVDCRSIVIYGGREHSFQTGYICNENLESSVKCAPCWKWNDCDYDRKCMKMIGVDDVLSAFDKLAGKKGAPLEISKAVI